MGALQTIINYSSGLTINRRKVVGTQITKNEIPRTSVTPTKNPWQFTVDFPPAYRYSELRAVLEALDQLDRYLPETITFSNNPCINWIFRYQGVMTPSEISAITVTSFEGNQLVLEGLPTTSGILFAPNDLIQIGSYPYPFTVVTQINAGSSSATLTTNRPNILSADVVGESITVGAACQFNMFCPNMPTYKLIPGGTKYDSTGARVNNALIEFSDAFQLYEYVGTA
jgi:hypothetical protein